MSHTVEGRASRPSSKAGTRGSPPAFLIPLRSSLLACFLLLVGRFLFCLRGSTLDRVFHNLARHRVDVDFVDAIRHLDVEGVDQLSFFPFNLLRLNFAGFLGQGSLLRSEERR